MIQVTKNDRTCQNKMCQPGISRRQFLKQRSDPTHPPAPLAASSPTQMSSQSSAWLTTSENWNCFVSWMPVKSEVTSCVWFTKCLFFLVYYCSTGQFLQPCLHLALLLAPHCSELSPSNHPLPSHLLSVLFISINETPTTIPFLWASFLLSM